MSDKGNGKQKQMKLTDDERLVLQNIGLQRQIIQLQAERAAQALVIEQEKLVRKIEDRIGHSLKGFGINVETGVITAEPPKGVEANAN
jgi:hypothetical protein